MYCAMNNHHISSSFSNHSLFYTAASELQVDCVFRYEKNASLILSPIILSILQEVSTSTLCIAL